MNDAPPSLDELISRHFDEALPSAEHQRLTAALNDDFDTRLDFVEAARLHAGLEALAPALPPARKWHPARWVMAGAAAAVMIGGGVLFWQQPRGGQIRITLQDMDARPDGKPEKPKPSGLVKRVVKAPAAALAAGAEPVDVQMLLERYYVNVSPHGLTVPLALEKLHEEIRRLNLTKRQVLDELVYFIGSSRFPNSADPMVRTPIQLPMTAWEYIQICTNFRRASAIIPQPKMARAMPFEGTWERNETRELKVRPDFLSLAAEPVASETPNWMAEHLKRNYGMDFEFGESASFDAGTTTLSVHAKRWKLDLLEQHLSQLSGQIVQNAYVTGKFIKLHRTALPAGFDEATGMIMDQEGFNGFLASLEDDASSAIFASPIVMMRPGQRSQIEIRQETQDPGEWIGFSQSVTAIRSGELVKVEGEVDLGIPVGGDMPHGMDILKLSGQILRLPGQTVTHFETGYELWLPDGSVGLFVLDLPENQNEVVLVCVGATMIDPAGMPIQDGADPAKMPHAK